MGGGVHTEYQSFNPTTEEEQVNYMGDDAVTLQARDSVQTPKTQDNATKTVDDKTNIQSSLQEPPRTKTTEIVCYYHEENKDVHEERRLQIEELDERREHKPRTHDKPKLSKNKPDTSPNQLQVGHIVLLDVVDLHIVTTTPNEEIPLTYIMSSSRGKKAVVPSSKRCKGPGSSSVVMMNNDDLGTIHFRLGSLVHSMSVPEFGVALGLYIDDHSKASALPPSLHYLHAILAHTLTGRIESTGVITTHDAYYLWYVENAHVTDLAYFIAFAIRHQTKRHRK
ncbi:hypothetical protein GOBAR_AA05252 [Gossypium barbadense]|uniref:Uncharacterized protein n=1 Tax=Gossypium barbadense TaxID=3634 RepID=A0A2P5YIA7_GOSBA|nr:hypothetical protein GOBAR_AA05252 [Gossypium barbadense]